MDLLDTLLDPWRSGIDRRALLEVTLLGIACGALSFWIVAFRLSYPAESLAHGLLPGLVVAALLGIPLLVGAGAGVGVATAAVALAARDERIGADTATAVVVTGMFGLGALLALSPDAPARLGDLLFGDPLGVTDTDLAAAAGLIAVGGPLLLALHRPLCAVAFDPGTACSLGISAGLARAAVLGLLATALAVAVQGLGTLLVLAVLIAPAAAVGRHARSPGRAMGASAAIAVGAGIVGIYASAGLGTAAGASVALVLCLSVALSVVARRLGRGGRRRVWLAQAGRAFDGEP